MKCRVRESRLISINEDEGKSTGAGVSEVYQINRGQSRSNQAFGSQPNAWACEVKSPLRKLLNQNLFSMARRRSTSAVIKT